MERKVRQGDKISALGMTFIIGEIFYQDCFKDQYDVEFLDTNGGYHHWKQCFDGGKVIFQ